MDKLIVGANGQATISNDGATIMKLLEVVHPAAKTLVDIARAQDAEVGDGTTSVVLLAAELMRESRTFIEDGVSPHIIIKGYRKAAQLVSSSRPLLDLDGPFPCSDPSPVFHCTGRGPCQGDLCPDRAN